MDLLNCNRGGEAVRRYLQNRDPGLTIQPSKYDNCRLHKLDSPQKSDRAGLSLPSSHSSIGPSQCWALWQSESLHSRPSVQMLSRGAGRAGRHCQPGKLLRISFKPKLWMTLRKFPDNLKSLQTLSKVFIPCRKCQYDLESLQMTQNIILNNLECFQTTWNVFRRPRKFPDKLES